MPGLTLVQGQIHTITLEGGATESIFPEVEKQLRADGYMEALQYMAGYQNASKYKSVIDFVFCELTPVWQPFCKRFYAGHEKPLRELLSAQSIKAYNARMLIALDAAYYAHQDQRQQDWGWCRERVAAALRAA